MFSYHWTNLWQTPSCIALYFVSKIASEHVKVVLSGEGADELFGGYDVYNEPLVFKNYRKLPQGLRTWLKIPPKNLKNNSKGKAFVTRENYLPTNISLEMPICSPMKIS